MFGLISSFWILRNPKAAIGNATQSKLGSGLKNSIGIIVADLSVLVRYVVSRPASYDVWNHHSVNLAVCGDASNASKLKSFPHLASTENLNILLTDMTSDVDSLAIVDSSLPSTLLRLNSDPDHFVSSLATLRSWALLLRTFDLPISEYVLLVILSSIIS